MRFSEEPTVYLFKKMWGFSKDNRRQVILFVLLFIIANLIDFLNPLVIAWLLNTLQQEGLADPIKLISITSLVLLTTVAQWACHGPARVLERNNAFLARAHFKKYLLDGVLQLPASWHSEHHSGDTIDKVQQASAGLFRFSSNTFLVMEFIVKLVSSFIALTYFNIHSLYIVILVTAISAYITLHYDKRLKVQYKQLNTQENVISAKVYDTISNITTIIILRIEKLLSAELFKKIMAPFTLYRNNATLSEVKWFLVSCAARVLIVLVIVSYVIQQSLTNGVILVGTLYVLYGYTDRISGLFYRFAGMYGDIVKDKASVENVDEIAALFEKKKAEKQASLANWKRLVIDGLTFSYHGNEGDLHLNSVGLTIHRGERIALIGESGSGKTTFLKLLRGIYEPKKANMVLDDQELSSGIKTVESHITLIPQDAELFATTILENITMGVSHSPEYVKKYAKLACFDHVAMRLPKEYKSKVNERGVNLSGGEKQRLALSRGLLACKDKEIILLDEPTSSVDAKNELAIYDNIFREFKGKTIISTIHRLNLLDRFDTIYMFSGGRIIAQGSLSELLKTSPAFRGLWKKYKEKRK